MLCACSFIVFIYLFLLYTFLQIWLEAGHHWADKHNQVSSDNCLFGTLSFQTPSGSLTPWIASSSSHFEENDQSTGNTDAALQEVSPWIQPCSWCLNKTTHQWMTKWGIWVKHQQSLTVKIQIMYPFFKGGWENKDKFKDTYTSCWTIPHDL